MARQANRLTALWVARVTEPGLFSDGHDLYLRVTASGAKSWVFRYRTRGRLRDMGIGPLHTVSLAEARAKALALRKLRLDGIDPIDERRGRQHQATLATARSVTFKECAERFIRAHQVGWKNVKHAKQWPSTLEAYVYPVFGNLPVSAIDTALVMQVLEPVWGTRTETANRVRRRVENVLDWATSRGYREGDNPARWRGHLENLLPKRSKVRAVVHLAALPYSEMPTFMAALREHPGIAARAVEFAILTVARSGEVRKARWDEFDIDARLRVIPGARMKAGKEHRVPLGQRALAVLDDVGVIRQENGENGLVFPGRTGGPISDHAMTEVLKRLGRGDVVLHGFRSTFSDWCAEQTATPSEVREMALAHTVGDRVEAAYRRGDLFSKRRLLMEEWGRFCSEPISTTNVVRIA
jgi:integrase